MILPDQTPKLPKWPFLAGDAALLVTAWLVAANAASPLHAEAIVAVVACVICAALLGAVPFLSDYARRQDEALDTRQRSLEALTRNATTAAEQISIAAAGLRETADSADKSLGQVEQLPRKLQEQLAAFTAEAARSRAEEKKALEKELAALRSSASEKLEAAVDKLVRAAVESVRLAGDAKKTAPVLSEPPAPPTPAAAPEPAQALAIEDRSAVGPAKEEIPPIETKEESPAADGAAPQGGTKAETPKPPRKRAPRKPAEPVAPAEAPPTALPDFSLESPTAAASEFAQSSPEEISPASSIAADGASRLLVTAYIGIGNRLFIRGKGPGLSWERGVPLQFVSIGKWRWDTDKATAPIAFKLYKNDEIECSALGTGTLEPGHQQEVTAAF